MRRRAVDGADREAAQPVVVQLAVPHPEAQQHAVDVVLSGRLRREDSQSLTLTFAITQSTGTEVLAYLPAHQDRRGGVRCDGQNGRRSIRRCGHKQETQRLSKAGKVVLFPPLI